MIVIIIQDPPVFSEYEMQGVPVRIAIGARDMEKNIAEVRRRDTKEKIIISMDGPCYLKTCRISYNNTNG